MMDRRKFLTFAAAAPVAVSVGIPLVIEVVPVEPPVPGWIRIVDDGFITIYSRECLQQWINWGTEDRRFPR